MAKNQQRWPLNKRNNTNLSKLRDNTGTKHTQEELNAKEHKFRI